MKIEAVVLKYSNMLFKIAMVMLGNPHDAQDALQDTFCRYMEKHPSFRDEEHEKAWLIKVTTNICRDMLRFQLRHPRIDIDDLADYYAAPEQGAALAELMLLPPKLKIVIVLHYVEGYHTGEVAEILGLSPNAVKKRLQRGRSRLRALIIQNAAI